jgi:hypothetical protein
MEQLMLLSYARSGVCRPAAKRIWDGHFEVLYAVNGIAGVVKWQIEGAEPTRQVVPVPS